MSTDSSTTLFEAAEIGRKVSKEDFEAELKELRVRLLEAQHAQREARVPVVLVLTGTDRRVSNELLSRLHEWLDASGLEAHAVERGPLLTSKWPFFWRFWAVLPPRGKMGIYFAGWPVLSLLQRYQKELGRRAWEQRIEHIETFEEELAADGALVLKIWLHLPKKELKKRLKRAGETEIDEPFMAEIEQELLDGYERIHGYAEEMIRKTSHGHAPWHVIESTDRRAALLEAGRILAQALERRVAAETPAPPATPAAPPESDPHTILDRVDLTQRLEPDEYRKRLEAGQGRLFRLCREAFAKDVASVFAFEGWDGGGKGGAIRRMTLAMPAWLYRVIRISKPTEEELAHHYLWRFWRQVPPEGHVRIFDRSWYGRVLVERVEGFAREDEWRRAYAEIVDFEEQLAEHGIVLAKFWMHIDPDEQLRRFKAREQQPWKHFKITDDDYRNREKWPAYEAAAGEMFARTSTSVAPWHVIAANDKRWARVQVLETVCDAYERALGG